MHGFTLGLGVYPRCVDANSTTLVGTNVSGYKPRVSQRNRGFTTRTVYGKKGPHLSTIYTYGY